MSASDWEEVKRLAADFQRAQLSSSDLRLTERNCIEIINKLIERKQIVVYFTTDGKEYITPKHLRKELSDELYVHGGRLNLVDAAKILSVDLSILTPRAQELEKENSSLQIVNGELIEQQYVNTLCEEINEKLLQHGQITIGDLTGQYGLPTSFLLSIVEKNLGKSIQAIQDKEDHHLFYTPNFIQRNLCVTRGALMAVTRPTSIASILSVCGVEERLFFCVIDTLVKKKEIPGIITGKRGSNCMYIPYVYTKAQQDYVTSFFNQNGYLEYSSVSKVGISDPVSFIKRNFSSSNIVLLESCAVGPTLIDQIEASVDEVIATGSFVNILPLLPSVIEEQDAEVILKQIIKKKTSQNLLMFNSTFIFTEIYLKGLLKLFAELIEKKAQDFVSSGAYIKSFINPGKSQNKNHIEDDKYDRKEGKGKRGGDGWDDEKTDRKEERRKKASEGKGGGGTQGRETKTKSTKKKYGKVAQNDEPKEEKQSEKLEIIKLSDIKEVLNNVELLQEEEEPEELIEELAKYFHSNLNRSALEAAKAFYETTIASSHQTKRKKHNELEEKLNDLVMKIRFFEKGYKQFTSKDVQQQLAKYLLKSVCTDVANDVFTYVAQDNVKLDGKEITSELRVKIANDLPNNMKQPLLGLHNSLNSSSADEFLNVIEAAVGPGVCDIILKKPDKKKERPHLLNYRQQLIEQLNVTQDAAVVLHLTTLIIFQGVTQSMLHASGRFVSTILSFLQQHLPPDEYNVLQHNYDLVLKLLSSSDAEEKAKAENSLQNDLPKIKEIALSFKKITDKSRLSSE